MKKNVSLLLIIAVLSKIGGFIKDIALTYYYGASYITDAYFVSLTIPSSVLALISTTINTSYIPIYSEINKVHGYDECNNFTNQIANLILIFCTVFCAVVILFTKPIVWVFASGFEAKALETAIMFTRLSIVQLYFMAISHLFHTYLQLHKSFLLPELFSLPPKLIIILSILVSAKTNISILIFGTVTASILETVILLILSYRKKYRYKPKLNIKDPNLKKMSSLTLPALVGTSTSQINLMAGKSIASRIAEGGITALNYARQLEGFITGTIVQSTYTVVYPDMARKAANNDIEGLKRTLSSALTLVSLLIIPGTIGAMVFAEPIVKMFFNRGAFDDQAARMTSMAWFYYSTGMLWFGVRALMVRAFYALQDTKSPVINSFIGVAINIFLNIVLYRFLGIGGLALAVSISEFISMILLMIVLRRKIGSLHLQKYILASIKIFLVSLFMGYVAHQAYQFLTFLYDKNLSLILSIILGTVIYTVAILFMKIEVVDLTARNLYKRLIKLLKKKDKIKGYSSMTQHMDRKKRVLQICGIDTGGIESLVKNLVLRLRNKYDFEVYTNFSVQILSLPLKINLSYI
jgi:putative peptidoglycan lipid II flippase